MSPEFIFNTDQIWLGEGKITFSFSSDFIKFYTRWEISKENDSLIMATQIVEMQGVEEHVVNLFTFSEIQPTSFLVSMESETIKRINGTGVRSRNLIAWEFKGPEAIDGFEVYERQENGDYFLHGEYGLSEQGHTTVEGLIWCKSS